MGEAEEPLWCCVSAGLEVLGECVVARDEIIEDKCEDRDVSGITCLI